MGAACARGSRETSSVDSVKHTTPTGSKSNKTQLPAISETNKSKHSAEEILDDNFKSQVTGVIDDCILSIPIAYQAERDRIINEMSLSAPEPYLGLLFSEYPDENGSTVNEMARRLVTCKDFKQEISDRVNERIESNFASRTGDWDSSSRETARPVVKTFIEKLVNDAVDCVVLE